MPPTFPVKTSSSKSARAEQGLTLLELMVVLAIISGVVFVAIGRLGGPNTQMRAAVRKLSAMSRQIHSTAKLKGSIYRVVIDLKTGDKGKTRQSYWIEKSTGKTILTPEEMEEKKTEEFTDSKEPKAPDAFAPDTQLMKETELPNELYFQDVELARQPDKPITEGKVYIHFFPQGLGDEAAIHLASGEKMHWTLSINPITGKTDVTPEYVSLKELQNP